ncbi:MAG: phage minor head protein [Sphaerochaetaceae bacterium]|nr:phage minor head protein [Sphaerochaetaceae bacterium]
MVRFDFNLEPNEAIEYLRNKGYKLSFDYTDVSKEVHHKAFTVAKMTSLDLLTDVHQALLKAMKDGTGFDEFQKNIQPTLEKKGWWGLKEMVNPSIGEVKTVNIGSSRLRTIYETNMRTAYNVAREQQMDKLPLSVYRRYVSALLENTRYKHAKSHGTIKHKDDKWWVLNSPPNDFNCKCRKQAVSLKQMKKQGWSITEGKLENIASNEFAYDIREHKYKLDNLYFQKVQALKCKQKAFAKDKKVLCPFEETIKENYKSDMLSLRPSKQEWDKFVDDSLDKSIKNHQSVYLGFLTMVKGLEEYLDKTPPKSDLILADTGTIRNLRAKGADNSNAQSPKNVLTIDQIKELHTKIHIPDEIYHDGDILLIYDIDKGKSKLVIKIDYESKKYIYNDIYSGQVYEDIGSLKYNVLKDAKKVK